MPRPTQRPKPPEHRIDTQLCVLVTKAQRERLQARALRQGVSQGYLVRRWLMTV